MHVGPLTLTLVGTVRRRRPPWLLVEAGAAAVTGAPARVVLAGTLQPVRTQDTGGAQTHRGPRVTQGGRGNRGYTRSLWRVGATAGVCVGGWCLGQGTEWSVRWPLHVGQPGALGPVAMPSPSGPGPKAKPWRPGLAPRARSHSAGSPELSQTPPLIQGTSLGRWPRAASSSSQGWTPLKRAGILPAILENSACWLSGQGTAGLSWEPRLQPHTAQAPMPKPHPQHRPQLSRGGGRKQPQTGLCAPGSQASTTAAVLCETL